ncbi:MAG: hypothetical protein ACR2QK_02315 [Acidimicrobiales bacterium]
MASVAAFGLVAAGCLLGSSQAVGVPDAPATPTHYFETLPPGSVLPDGETCAEMVLVDDSEEVRPENTEQNNTTVDVAVEQIDGADELWNEALAPRIDGNFTGTTEQLLRWAACKWGFDENVTRARAVSESTWFVSTEGDTSDSAAECALLGLDAPCPQSYGLLQVKGTVHEGTYPYSTQSTAFGLDYAMAWLRACYEGSFTWLIDEDFQAEDGYGAGNEYGCVGTWFSGEWWDQPANDYVGEVRYHVENESWLQF